MSGSSRVDWNKFSAVLQEVQPNSMIVVPALLQGLMHCAVHYKLDLSSLNFIAVGGAPVSSNLLRQAQDMGLPVYQGYGMTECASVICLNTPEDNRIGSVGKPLPHVDIRIDEHGEIVVRGGGFIAYMNTPTRDEVDEWCTGDLGYFDAQGYLYVTARRSSSYSSAYGRNIAPEWVESELDSETVIAQSAVFGEGRKHNISVLVPVNAQVEDSHIAACVVAANRRLPDYAQIAAWTRADSVFEISNSQCSASGVLQREQIYSAYRVTLDQLFEESEL